MKYQPVLWMLVVVSLTSTAVFAQLRAPLPVGKCLLTMKAEIIRGKQVANVVAHTFVVTVTTSGFGSGEYINIKTDNSKTDMTGQADLAPGGASFKDMNFSLSSTGPIEFTSGSVGKMAEGEFRYTAKEDNGVYTDAHGTKGSFTLVPIAPTTMQPTPIGAHEKEIFNSTEEWWVAIKSWMLGSL